MSSYTDEEPDSGFEAVVTPTKKMNGANNPSFHGALQTEEDGSPPPDKSANRKLRLPLFLVFTLSIAYIVMVYLALPLVINVVTTRARIKSGELDPHTNEVLATSISQFRYTWVLSGQRLATLLTANLIGALADVYGRKPLILVGVTGYLVAVVLFFIGWFADSWECFLVGSIALGCVTPIIPIIIAVAGDVSTSVATFTLHSSHVFGIQNLGLLSGMLVTVGLRVALANDTYFIISFAIGGALSLIVFFAIFCGWSETLTKEKRKPKLDWKLANPFGFLFVVTRNPYVFFIWGANCLYWFSLGASEAVFANWWMLRYFITDTRALPLLWFLISTWIFTGTGQFILPKCYLKLCGVKLLLHIAIICGIVGSLVVSYAADPIISYVGTSINFWASPGPPTLLTLFLAQSETSAVEGGAMTGVYRASQAGFRMIGSAAIGSYMAAFIAPYTPPLTCVPRGYHPQTNPSHSCDCGVKSCPVNNTVWLPSACTFGRLTPVASTKPGFTPVPTQKLLSMGITERCGTPFFGAARETSVARAWCAGPDPWVGCRGLDVAALTRDGQIAAVMKACLGVRRNATIAPSTLAPSLNPTIAPSVAPTLALTFAPSATNSSSNSSAASNETSSQPTSSQPTSSQPTSGQPTSTQPTSSQPTPTANSSNSSTPPNSPQWIGGPQCNATTMAALKMSELAAFDAFRTGKLSISNQSLDPVRLNRSMSILARQGCPEEGDVTISLCRDTSLGPRPEEPAMIMFFYPILAAYLFYLIAEICFRKYQKVQPEQGGQGLLLDCCGRKNPVQPVQTPTANPVRNKGPQDVNDLRRQSEGEVMLPQDPLATLKRGEWEQNAVVVHGNPPENSLSIHS